VVEHGGKPETAAAAAPSGGLHGSRLAEGGGAESTTPLRFVMPPGALVREAKPAG